MSHEEVKTGVSAADEDSFAAGWDAEDPTDVVAETPKAGIAAAAAPEAVPAETPAADVPAAAAVPEVPAPSPAEEPVLSPEEKSRIANERSMQGRLEAERRKNAELLAQLRSLESRAPAQPASPATSLTAPATSLAFAQPIKADSVDEEARIQISEFVKANPELAPLIVEDSKDGERMRRILSEYGGDHTATAAEMVVEKRRMVAAEAQRVQATQKEIVVNHYKRLAADHPEYADAMVGTTDESFAKRAHLQEEIQAWISTLPYDQGVYAANAIAQGTTDEVSFVLEQFKQSQAAPVAPIAPAATQAAMPAGVNAQRTRRAAEAGLAVPVRSAATLPKSTPDKDDFDSAWNED